RGGRAGAWLFESACAYSQTETQDDAHPLRLVAELGDRQLAPTPPRQAGLGRSSPVAEGRRQAGG
ncbi:MAG TPA: hypothetical protein PKB04_08020, partial [Phenylobacterium sp.]|nr:hypothetical protein [Phenylobacterium sp.]